MNNFFLTRIKRLIVLMSMVTVIVFSSTQTVFAYDANIHEVTDDLCWVVNNDVAGDYDASAALFMLVQPDSGYETTRNYYGFDCTEGVFDFGDGYVEDTGSMQYWFIPMNKVVYDTIDEGEIWLWRFGLQNGKYIFAGPDGLNHFYVLNSSLGSPFSEDGYTEGDVVVVENDYHPIYALYGDPEWAKENLDVMIEWAKNVEANRNNGRVSLAEDVNVIEVETGNEGLPDKEEIATEESNSDLGMTDISNEDSASALQEISEEETEQIEKEKKSKELKSNLFSLLKTAPFVIFLIIFLFWIKNRDDHD